MRDKMVTLTFMVLTIFLCGAKAVPVEITQQPPGTEPKIRQVAFAVHFRDYNVDVGKHSPMKFDIEETNIGNGYNKSTGKFTAPTSGIYSFNLQIMNDPFYGPIEAAVNFNGTLICQTRANGDFVGGFCTTNAHLKVRDEVFAEQIGGSTIVRGQYWAVFSGSMISYDIK